jgi:hypothetical protein
LFLKQEKDIIDLIEPEMVKRKKSKNKKWTSTRLASPIKVIIKKEASER